MEFKKISKEKLLNIANTVGNATKSTVSNIGEATKNAAITVAENVKEGSEQLNERLDQMKYDNDKKRLCPIYKEELLAPDFVLPALIHIVDYDKRKENKACEGAVGFLTGKEAKILNVYREFVNLLDITFYPILEDAVYYVDPCFSNLYVKLDEYFAYLKKVRVDELTTVAQALGAKHVEIVLKGNQRIAQSQSSSVSGGASKRCIGKANGEFSSSRASNEFTGVEVAAKIDFGGNETSVEPKLVYFKNESDINALIKMRLNPSNENKILSKTYSLQYGNSSGIKVSDAQKIDASLTQINCGMSRSVTSEAMSESNTILEYTIVF